MMLVLREKFDLYGGFLFSDVPRLYRQKYTLLYPHGILRKVGRDYHELRNIQVFVETGTFKGKTARVESDYFREVETIELNDRVLDSLGRERVADYFETEYQGKKLLNIVLSSFGARDD